MDAEGKRKLVEALAEKFYEGGSFSNITLARKYAETITGEKIDPGTLQAKQLDEIIESAVVRAATKIVSECDSNALAYDRLVDLYQRQPALNVRTSTSVREQAYSTPIPLAYLAATLAEIDEEKTVYEPAGGHGSLLIKASKNLVQVNELNPERAEDLRAQGFTVTENDATTYTPKEEFDVVILNPPFGSDRDERRETKRFLMEAGAASRPGQTWPTTQIDHVIALHSLAAMKPDGKSVLILGGKKGTGERDRSNRYNTQMSRAFYQTLYSNYNVKRHISIDGDLYRKQGAGFPIDLIVIEGKGRSNLPLPAAEVPKIYTSFEQLKELIDEEPATGKINRPGQSANLVADPPTGNRDRSRNLGSRSDANPINREPNSLSGTAETPGVGVDRAGTDLNFRTGSLSGDADSARRQISGSDSLLFQESAFSALPRSVGGSDNAGQRLPVGDVGYRGGDGISRNSNSQFQAATGESSSDRFVGLAEDDDAVPFINFPKTNKTVVERGFNAMAENENLQANADEEETHLQVAYAPISGGNSLNTLVPTNLSSATQRSLSRLAQKVRPQVENSYNTRGIPVPENLSASDIVDTYVMQQLDIPNRENLHSRLSAEQIDAAALFINAVSEGKTFIQGDQTGIGKGRNAALAIAWAKQHGLIPIFITQSPELHSAIMADLADIGQRNLRPFPTTGERIDTPNNGSIRLSDANQKPLMQQFTRQENLGGTYDFVVTTYSQLQNVRGRETPRHEFLRKLAPNALVVMDECHNAIGASRNALKQSSRALFARELLEASRGALLLSATSMKDANYSLYAKTDMSLAVDGNVAALDALAARGGIPMMQMVSVGLAASGQYIRRERSYEGVKIGATVAEIDLGTLDEIYSVMADIVRFDDIKQAGIKELDKALKAEAKTALGDNATGFAGAESSNFTSIMHNLSSQILLAAKAETSVQWAIALRESGKKPVLALYNTMGSAIDRYVEENGLKPGDAIEISFGDLLQHYAERSREIRTRDAFGNQIKRRLTDEEIGAEGALLWEEIRSKIDSIDFSSLPVSPIDYIRHRLEQHGITTDEVTGRSSQINYTDNPPTYSARRPREASPQGRKEAVDRFNNGQTDAIILNSAGSTGISLHASEKFNDRSPRVMGILQSDPKITGFMQMLGRVHRTGQVALPEFEFISTSAPAEIRPTAVLLKKLAALNANTTATRQSAFNLDDTVDFINEYGDRVVAELLEENPRIDEKLDHPLDYNADSYEEGDDVRKVTGRAVLLSTEEQKWFLDTLIERYRELIAQMEAIGESTLEAKSVDLDARTLAKMEVKAADKEANNSPFTQAVYLEVIDAKTPAKPYTQLQCVNQVRSSLGLEPVASLPEHDFAQLEQIGKESANRAKIELKVALEDYQKLATQNKSEDRTAKIKAGLNAHYEQIACVLETLPVGQTVRIQTGQNIFYGTVAKIWQPDRGADEITGKISNPAAPSNWKIKFAVADAAREITVPLSKIGNKDGGLVVTPAETDAFKVNIYELFDHRQSKGREQRQIFTGNILRAYMLFEGKGRAINFTDNKGNVRQGILMPKGFDIQKELESQPVKMPSASDVKRFITTETHYTGHIKTEDGTLKIQARGDGRGYMLSTPRSKMTGGTYYLDSGLINACGGEFTSVGDAMRVMVSSDQIDQALNYLMEEKQHSLCAFEQRSIARKMLGIELPTMESLEAGTFGNSGEFRSRVGETDGEQISLDFEKVSIAPTAPSPSIDVPFSEVPSEEAQTSEVSPREGGSQEQVVSSRNQESDRASRMPQEENREPHLQPEEDKSKQLVRRTKEFVRNATNPYVRAKLEGLPVASIGFGIELFDSAQTDQLIQIFEKHASYRHNPEIREELEKNLADTVLNMHAEWMSSKTARQVAIGLIDRVELAQAAYDLELYKDEPLYGTPFWSMIQKMAEETERSQPENDGENLAIPTDPRLKVLPPEEVAVLIETLLANKLTATSVRRLHSSNPDAAKEIFEIAAEEAIASRHVTTKSKDYLQVTGDESTQQQVINGLYDAYLTQLDLRQLPSQPTVELPKEKTLPETSNNSIAQPNSTNNAANPITIALPQHQNEAGAKKVAKLLHNSGLADEILKGEDFHLKIENEPYIPLVIERHNNELYLTHYLTQGGDTFIDSEMVYRINSDGSLKLKEVATQNPFSGGEARSLDRGFAATFAQNLLHQGFAEAAAKKWQLFSSDRAETEREQNVSSPVSPEKAETEREQNVSSPVSSEKADVISDGSLAVPQPDNTEARSPHSTQLPSTGSLAVSQSDNTEARSPHSTQLPSMQDFSLSVERASSWEELSRCFQFEQLRESDFDEPARQEKLVTLLSDHLKKVSDRLTENIDSARDLDALAALPDNIKQQAWSKLDKPEKNRLKTVRIWYKCCDAMGKPTSGFSEAIAADQIKQDIQEYHNRMQTASQLLSSADAIVKLGGKQVEEYQIYQKGENSRFILKKSSNALQITDAHLQQEICFDLKASTLLGRLNDYSEYLPLFLAQQKVLEAERRKENDQQR